MQIYFWINEVKRDRTDLSTIASPEREPDADLAAFIAGKPDADPHLSSLISHPSSLSAKLHTALGDFNFNGELLLE
jgi:hypothetical protein